MKLIFVLSSHSVKSVYLRYPCSSLTQIDEEPLAVIDVVRIVSNAQDLFLLNAFCL